MSSPYRPSRLAASQEGETGVRLLAERLGPPDQRPALRKDLSIRKQVRMGEVVWIVKDPEKRAYYQFRDPQWQLIQLFDGVRTRTDIQEEYNRQVTKKDFIRLERVLEYEEWLRGMELIEESAAERGFKLLDKFRSLRERAAEEKAEGFNIFFIRFHVVDPDRFLNRTVKYVRWLWTPPVVVATCIAAIWTVSVFINDWEPIWIGTKDLYHFWGKPLLDVAHFFFILCIIAGIHELAHAYATKMYGGEVHDIGMALFYFTPAFYCNTSDSFMFPSRLHRLWVTIAGIYIEVIICSVATALWIASYPDSFLHQFAYKTMLLTGISTIFFNINPLIKVDGYYALSSVLDLQDLREGSFRFLGTWFQKHILRLPVEVPVMTRRRKRISVVYGLLAMTYTASIMVLVGKLFNNLYTSYFPDIATALLIVTLFYIFRKRLRKVGRVGKLFYLDKKELLMSPKSRVPLTVAGGIVLLGLLLPWSHRTISAESTLQPARTARLEAPDDAVISEVLVHEGDLVQRGQPIFRLSSASIDEETARLISEQQRFATASARGLAANDATLVFKSQRNASAVLASSRSVDVRRRDLVVRSPIQGRVLTPRTQDLVGRNVAKGSALARIGDCRRMAAEINVTERLLEYLHPGARVTAQVRTRPMKTEVGMIARISAATLEQPKTSVGEEEPVAPHALPDRFVALASFDNPDGTLLPGAAVKVKIRSNREAYLVRIWSVLWRWLRSVVW